MENDCLKQLMKKLFGCEKIQRLLIAVGMFLLDWKNYHENL